MDKLVSRLTLLLCSARVQLGLLLLLANLFALQSYLISKDQVRSETLGQTHNDNYLIFQSSFQHLTEGKNLYTYHWEDHSHRFKYSPTFAVGFAAIGWMPVWLGMMVWANLAAFLVWLAVRRLPGLSEVQRLAMLGFVLLEVANGIQVAQTNHLVAALLILALADMESGMGFRAMGMVMTTVFIKLVGLAMALLVVMYPQRWRLSLYGLPWALLLFLIPLGFVSWDTLLATYHDWWEAIREDHGASYGMSVHGLLQSWWGLDLGKLSVLLVGLAGMALPLLRVRMWSDPGYRQVYLGLILIWLVIFNHKAESPSYAMAAMGIGVWYFSQPATRTNTLLILFAFLVMSILFSDFFPKSIRDAHDFHKYCLKTLPCLIIWGKGIWDLMQMPGREEKMTSEEGIIVA